MQPGHMASAPRYLDALKGTMKKFDEWIGPYPYSQITVVDPRMAGVPPEDGISTFITADTTWWMIDGFKFPSWLSNMSSGTNIGMRWWPPTSLKMRGSTRASTHYTECKIMDALYGRDVDFLEYASRNRERTRHGHASYIGVAELDPMTRRGWQFLNFNSYGGITYSKTTLVLLTLEHIIGEQKGARGAARLL